jgi:shikimate dehydrogenase
MSATPTAYTLADLHRWPEVSRDFARPGRLAVIGDPVAHSRSPQMHNPALRAAGIDGDYVRVHLRPSELEEGIAAMRAAGFIGFNVTIPHKSAVFELVDELSETARRIGAVNTVAIRPDMLSGHNTDAPGLQRAVREAFSADLSDLRIAIIGAGGGAGRAAAVQCALDGCKRLVLVNRTVDKVRELAAELDEILPGPGRIVAIPREEAAMQTELGQTDLIINATSLGMKPDDAAVVERHLLQPHHLVYDMVYSPPRTRLMIEAEEAGARAANGLGMLLWQGALAFEFWFGRSAPVEAMREGLKSTL